MKTSPFVYGSTVSIHSFTNREKEVEKLKRNLLSGINTMIISPRRWGKTSLVEKVIHEILREEKVITVVVDLFSVSSEEEFLEKFARELIKASSTRWEEWMNSGKTFFKNLMPRLSVGVDPNTDFGLSFDWKELKKHKEEVLDLPETIAKNKGVKVIICLDEFQNLSSFPDFLNFERKLRSVWQRHKSVTYCLYGSKRHMMTDIFNNPSKPFYRFGDIMLLQKIETERWVLFICEGFKNSGKLISEKDAIYIPKLMKNHSWYVQQLAHYTLNVTRRKAGIAEIESALKELINANAPLYQREIEIISSTQLHLLKAIARGETRLTSAAIMQKYLLGTPRNVSKNKTILVKNDIIQDVNDGYEFVDPAFERWFENQYFDKDLMQIV